MNARVTIVRVLPDKMDETIGIYRDSVLPFAKQQKGCQGVYMLTDRNTGKGISITLWDTEADMTAEIKPGVPHSASRSKIHCALPRVRPNIGNDRATRAG